MMASSELAATLYPDVKIDPSADGRHGDQLITRIVASVVSCMVIALLCREWRVFAYSCWCGTTAPTIVGWWWIFARDGVRHAPERRHPCKPLQGAISTSATLAGCVFIPHIPSLEGSDAHFSGGLHVNMGERARMLCSRSHLQKLYL